MQISGFIVGESEAAVAFVPAESAKVEGIRPAFVPRKKIESLVESDGLSKEIHTQQGRKVGFPAVMNVNDEFAAKIGWA